MNSVDSNNTNVYTYKMAMNCKEHICKHGYSYETFYRVNDRDRSMLTSNPDTAYEMHIAIQASSNGHILLSEVANPTFTDSVYEIVVGGGGNRFTELRRNLRRNAKSSVKTPDVLSTIEMRGFYIKISVDGIIEFGKEGEIIPLISFNDMFPLSIKYFSFAAWNGVEAKFLYDCPIPGTESSDATPLDSEPEQPKLTNSDTLKRTLLMGRLPSIPPSPRMTVKILALVSNVQLDPFESKLTTIMSVVTSWTDNTMAWDPSKFNGTTSLKFRQGQIWKPTFYVLNSNDIGVFDVRNPDLINMVNSGEATFQFQVKVKSLCSDYTVKMSKWPRDQYSCYIIIEPWEAHEKISLEILSNKDNRTKMFTGKYIENQWEVSAEEVVVEPDVWSNVFVTEDNQTHQSDRLIITLDIKRRATSYNIVFYTPLIVLTLFVLMSFWSEPLTMSRIWFYVGCIIFICMGSCFIDSLIPTHTVPSILILYVTVLGGVLLALLIHVALMSAAMVKLSETVTIQNILASNILRTIFCLPPVTVSINGGYTMQENEDLGEILPRESDVAEMERDNNNSDNKTELAVVIDKILFLVYSIVFGIMLAVHY